MIFIFAVDSSDVLPTPFELELAVNCEWIRFPFYRKVYSIYRNRRSYSPCKMALREISRSGHFCTGIQSTIHLSVRERRTEDTGAERSAATCGLQPKCVLGANRQISSRPANKKLRSPAGLQAGKFFTARMGLMQCKKSSSDDSSFAQSVQFSRCAVLGTANFSSELDNQSH